MRLRFRRNVTGTDFHQLLELIAELGVDIVRERYDERLPARVAPLAGRADIERRPSRAGRVDRVAAGTGALSVDTAGLLEAPGPLHVSQLDFIGFAGSDGSSYADRFASSTWTILHKFWEQQSVRDAYLEKAVTAPNEVNPGILVRTLEQSVVPLSFGEFDVDGEPTAHVNLISLYNSVKIVQASRTRGLIPDFGVQRIGFVSAFTNTTLNPDLFPPLPVAL